MDCRNPVLKSFHNKYQLSLKEDWLTSKYDLNNLTEKVLIDILLDTLLDESCVQSGICDDILSLHNKTIQGPLFLQINEIINIGENLEKRYKESPERTLKFMMTDGRQHFIGMELSRITNLSSQTPPGTKIILSNILVRRGILMMTASSVSVLGGHVPQLIALVDQAHAKEEKTLIPDEWANLLGELEK